MSLSARSIQYGKVFNNWTIQKEIGRGAKGTVVYQIVHKDMDLEDEEICALKAIPIISERGNYKSLSGQYKKDYQKALKDRRVHAKREVQHMLKVRNHTNIVNSYQYETVEWNEENEFGCDLLIRMELLHDLRSKLKRGRTFSEVEVIQIGRDICLALVLCHETGILHRDIKPENIFFDNYGNCKLGDFGIARILDKCPDSYASTAVGTPEYAAPEQWEGRYDMEADIYSLGLVLYELTNQNRLPFAKSPYVTHDEVKKRINAKTLPKPCDASPDLERIILKACAREPSDRYQSAQEMLDALAQIGNTEKRRPSMTQKIIDFFTHGRDYDPKPASSGFSRVSEPISTVCSYTTTPASPDFGRTDSSQNSDEQQPVLSDEVCDLLNKANAGDVEAMKNLGDRYYLGWDVTKDYSVAVKWYQKAADRGYPGAMCDLGDCYYNGYGVEKDYFVAVGWYQKATDRGYPRAMYQLGECYYNGYGVIKNYSVAVKWYQKAADKGYQPAMLALYGCYDRGYGVEANYSVALKWLEKSFESLESEVV